MRHRATPTASSRYLGFLRGFSRDCVAETRSFRLIRR